MNGTMLPLRSSLSTSSGKTIGFGKNLKLRWNEYFSCNRSKMPCWFKALIMRLNLAQAQDLAQPQRKLKRIEKAIFYSLNRPLEMICLKCCKNVICLLVEAHWS